MTARPITILCADDDEDDRVLTTHAFARSRLANDVRFVDDGDDLLAYLRRTGRWSDPASSPTPDIVLLDLNMPRKDGRQALSEIKADPALRSIPVIVLTTSQAEEDILKSYDTGASGYVRKPVSFKSLGEIVEGLGTYWFQIVELPRRRRSGEP